MPFTTRLIARAHHCLSAALLIVITACSAAPAAIPTAIPATSVPVMIVTAIRSTIPATSAPTVSLNTARATTLPTTIPKAATRTSVPPATSPRLNCNSDLIGGSKSPLPTIALSVLTSCRLQVRDTLNNINRGTFSFEQDNQTFGNYEGILPSAAKGTYREYTVLTSGSRTRGARRLISSGTANRASSDYKALYYTDDHYVTFWLVVEGK